MDIFEDIIKEEHSYFEFPVEVDSGLDWRAQNGADQNKNHDKNEYNGCVGFSNKLQRCFRCSEPFYYNSLNLLRHNLTHLQVNLEKLPDEIFHLYEPDPTKFECSEEPSISSEINQYNYSVHNDIKWEIVDIQSENNNNHFSNTETLSKDIEDNSNIEFAINVKQKNIDNPVIKYEIEENYSENIMDNFFDVEQLNKSKEHNNNQSVKKRKIQHFVSNIIKYEIEENSKDQYFGLENFIKAIEHNNNIEEDTIVIKNENEISENESTVETLNFDNEHHNIESETQIRLQRFDGAIIKCKIEEIDSDNSTDRLIYAENTKNDKEETNEIVIAKKIQHFSDSTIIKSEINNTKVKKSIVNVSKSKQKKLQCHICKKFVSYKQLAQHIKEVHTQYNVKCTICSKVFKCRRTMKSHVRNVHSCATYSCDHCQKSFKNKDCLQKHIKAHGKAVKCELCGSRLACELYLKAHIKRVHYDDGMVHSCDICGKIFKSPRYVKVHMKNTHNVSSLRKVRSSKKK